MNRSSILRAAASISARGSLRSAGSAAAGLLLGTVAGCLPIPHKHLAQPSISVRVADAAGAPLAGAGVTFSAADYVGGMVHQRRSAVTDSLGRTAFAEAEEWHPFLFLMIDADGPYQWGWCVDAPGFLPKVGLIRGPEPREMEVTLERAETAGQCPRQPRYLRDLPGPS